MNTTFRKLFLGVLIVALALAALPLASVYAAASNDTATPPAPRNPAQANARLEQAFATQKYRVELIGLSIDNASVLFTRTQALIDKAKSNGKDVSAVQSTFDAYKTAFENGKPIYAQAKALLDAHTGFDANGKVTNAEQAKATVKGLNGFLKQYNDTVSAARKALREAIQAFRQANPRSAPIPTPTGG